MAKPTESAFAGATPAFLTLDDRIPSSLKELLHEAEGCSNGGFLIGATSCAQRAVDAILKMEKVEGATHEARVRALVDKTPGFPQLLTSVLIQIGDVIARDTAKLPANTLQLLLATIKAAAWEIYVVAPERAERLQHVRRLIDATDRKTAPGTASAAAPAPTPAAAPFATPAALAAMGDAPAAPPPPISASL
jgi:cell division septation protein DedD